MNSKANECLGDAGVCIPIKSYSIKQKITNADKIRSMSDEELADLFSEKCKIGKEFAICWLQSEADS